MSTVSGPTPMSSSTTATATTAAPATNQDTNGTSSSGASTKVNNMMSSSSSSGAAVIPEAAARMNGSSQPSPALESVTTTADTSSSTLDNRSSNNNSSTAPAVGSGETKEEARGVGSSTSGADLPLPADLKRILAEVARTGSCSWLSWNFSGAGSDAIPSVAAASSVGGGGGGGGADSSAAAGTNATAAAAMGVGATGLGGSGGGKSAPFATAHAATLAAATTTTTTQQQQQQQSRRPYSTNRLGAIAPPRKKHRNGVKVRGHGGQSRKRPLFLIRTSGGSVGSGRTSGSEPDDSTQYECDSEGTSATSCSELSTERNHLRNMQRVAISASRKQAPGTGFSDAASSQGGDQYRCLKDVFRMALGLVLDHWYRHRGGYKLSPAEKRRSQAETATLASASFASALVNGESNILNQHHHHHHHHHSTSTSSKKSASPAESNINAKHQHHQLQQQQQQQHHHHQQQQQQQSESTVKVKDLSTKEPRAEDIFQQRRQRLLMMLGQEGNSMKSSRRNLSSARRYQGEDEGPPFTIQRIAEVLIAPERYYTQTHKLCNCLEKLLLVTSSTSAFGGSTGGITSQSRLEERELAALANEKGRLESEFRQRALKRRNSSMSDDLQIEGGGDAASRTPGSPSRDESQGMDVKSNSPSPEKKPDGDPAGSESSSREMLEAAARQLRTKFDHVGIDPHSSAVANRDVRSIAENRGMTNSPPPPSLAMSAAAASNIALPGHSAVGSFVRQHHPEQNAEHPNIARVPSPILFSQGNESSTMAPLHAPPNMHLLHMHHAAPLAGVSVGSTPFDVVTIEAGGSGASAPTATNLPGSNEGADLEGRSSASNSDVDSESDDVSFDDSASDRSDGSDSGHYEPFTAARAMALNRIQQQQRLQSRGGVLTSLALHQSEGGFTRPPADSEYQSGDSIDSTRGEDSGGSDSSSSDLAD